MKTKSFLLLAASLLCVASAASSAQTLTVAKFKRGEHSFFIEYLASLERHMGVTFKMVEVETSLQKRQLVETGKVDFMWARQSKQNRGYFRWSKPLITSELSLLIRKSEGKRPKDLKGKLVCAKPMPHEKDFVESIGAKLLPCPIPSQRFENLIANRCVAMVAPIESNIRIVRIHPELKKTFKHYKKAVKPQMFQFAFAMNKSNKTLQKQLNRAIQKTVEDGSYHELLNQYTDAE